MKSLLPLLIVFSVVTFSNCKRKGCIDSSATNYDSEAKKDDGSCEYADTMDNTPVLPPITNATNVEGFNILAKIPGIWNGPVFSPTPLGDFQEWIVDFRPISPSQVSAKNELDSINDIFMSFFICKYDNAYKVAFRNGGGFDGNVRNSYMIIDSLYESVNHSFYRFVDPVSGGNRVYTDVTFTQDSLIMHTFTNQFNTLSTPVTHMRWTAKLKDASSTQNAISTFGYPKKEMTTDFSTTFNGLSDAVFYSVSQDPYPESAQPYLGVSSINVNITNPSTTDPLKKVAIIITTQPLFNGFNFIAANLDYRSRYVLVGAESNTGFSFNYMHPGDYYVNAIYDVDGDLSFSSGDFMNSSFDVPFTLAANSTASANVTINFQIP